MNSLQTMELVPRAAWPALAPEEAAPEPGEAAALCREARAHLRLFDVEGYERALPLYRKALELDPGRAEAAAGLAFVYALWGFRREINGQESEGYYKLALQRAEQALKLAPKSAEAHRALAVALRRGAASDPVRRREAILTALDLEPECADNWHELWRASGSAASDPSIYRVFELEPSHCAAHIDLGVVLCEEGRTAEALAQFRLALKTNPRNSMALYDAAMVLNVQGQPEQALALLRKGLDLHPGDPLLQTGVGVVHGRKS